MLFLQINFEVKKNILLEGMIEVRIVILTDLLTTLKLTRAQTTNLFLGFRSNNCYLRNKEEQIRKGFDPQTH